MSRYEFEPEAPRAPSEAQWASMTEAERAAVVAMLPSEVPRSTAPEGDRHQIPKKSALEQLRDWFRRHGRSVYLSAELPVYYPGEELFAPDVIAVLDVEPHPRDKWVVSVEGRGLDFVLEVHVRGNAKKDREDNVIRYAKLAIPEYFLFEPLHQRLVGYRLEEGKQSYVPIVPQAGRWSSQVLGLDLAMEGGKVRFFSGAAPLPDAEELIVRLDEMVNAQVVGALERERELLAQLEDEQRAREREQARADQLAAKLRALGVDPDALD